MSLPVALTPGTVIGGHYVVGNLINRGGFGAVYRGIDKSEGNRPCAIKETYDVTPAARRQALMEASVLFTVRSKHLPEVYDAFEANGRFYLVMQLVEGQNLLQILQSRVPGGIVGQQEPGRLTTGPCSEQEVLSWLLSIMDVLQELHNRNPPIMHRDIKPGNIILTPQNTTVLVDFGLTKLYDPNISTQTMVKRVTEGFSPIEQYVGRTSPQSDIYSMAATLYLLLTNRLPPAAIGRSMQDDLIPPRELNPSITPKTERALLIALSLQADQRYQNMRAFAQALSEPAFAAYNDQTLASVPSGLTTTQSATRGISSQGYNNAPTINSAQQVYAPQPSLPAVPQPYRSSARPGPSTSGTNYQPAGYSPSLPAYPYVPASSVPGGVSSSVTLKGKKDKKSSPAQTASQVNKPLPNASSQGCLWGVVQGILATLIVLTLKQQIAFYLATLLGFGFYVLAGYITTHRGGSSLRGGWAGYWTGIYSTLSFWGALGLSLAVLYIQRVQVISKSYHGDFRVISGRAWNAVLPAWPEIPALLPKQPSLVNLLVLMLVGVVFAWLLGWVGGLIGQSRRAGP
jgi:serine/threonine protein kinase